MVYFNDAFFPLLCVGVQLPPGAAPIAGQPSPPAGVSGAAIDLTDDTAAPVTQPPPPLQSEPIAPGALVRAYIHRSNGMYFFLLLVGAILLRLLTLGVCVTRVHSHPRCSLWLRLIRSKNTPTFKYEI